MSGTQPGRGIAAFDLDETLVHGDTLFPFLRYLCGTLVLASAIARHSGILVAARLTQHKRDAAKQALLSSVLAGRSADDVRHVADLYAEDVVRARLRDDVMRKVAWHRREGHELVLVSASLDVYVGPIGRLLDFDTMFSTELAVDTDGRLTGHFRGPNLRGETKANRLRAHMGKTTAPLWVYGNRGDDNAMLAMATFPTVIATR